MVASLEDVRVPVVVQSDGDNVTVLLVLQRLQWYRPLSASIEVIPQELGRERSAGVRP